MVKFGAGATWTTMVAEAVRLPGVLLVDVTVAVSGSVPLKPAVVVPVTWKVTVCPAATVPRLSVTLLLLSVADGAPAGVLVVVTLLQVTPAGAGSGSVTVTPSAAPEPVLLTVIV